MGRIITVASSKGGSSKTSVVMLLAGNLAAMGYRVAVIDADPNGSFLAWHRHYEGQAIDCTAEPRQEEIVDHAQGKAREHEVVLIDTAGFASTTAAFACGTADLVLIPLMPDRASATEAMRTARQVQAFGKASRRTIPMRIIRSRWNPRGLVERAVLADLHGAELPLIEQHLSDLSEFGKTSLSGRVPVVGKLGNQAGAVITELIALRVVPTNPKRRPR